jgi:UDP-N-acetylmuramyl pentapeptide phosphotransferase/UDP-N-acetylglucosamine-1-phosphate transferase
MLILATAISFLLTILLLPVIIRFFLAINLLDIPEKRKVHMHGTPSMAGIAIFFSAMVTLLFIVPLVELAAHKYVIAGAVLTFLLGFRDDISSLQAKHKLAIQTLAAFLVVELSGLRFDSLYGLFGVYEIPYLVGSAISIFFIVSLSNAFNLIDGIDGLAGVVSVLVLVFLGSWFIHS